MSQNYDEYKKRQINAIILTSIIIVSGIATIQIFSAMDSIVEIRFSNDYYVDDDMIIEVFNTTTLQNENVSLSSLSYKFEFLNFMFIGQEYRLRMLNATQKAQWYLNAGLFPLETSEIINKQGYIFSKSIGFLNVNQSIRAGNVFKFRVPRGLSFFACIGYINQFPNVYNISSEMGKSFFSQIVYSFPRLNFYDLNTDYLKMVITINHFQFIKSSFDWYQNMIDTLESPDDLDFSDFPLDYIPPYSFNITVSREISLDIFNWNII
jgi:hypothetical protein